MSIFFSFNLFTVKLRGIESFVTIMKAVTEKNRAMFGNLNLAPLALYQCVGLNCLDIVIAMSSAPDARCPQGPIRFT